MQDYIRAVMLNIQPVLAVAVSRIVIAVVVAIVVAWVCIRMMVQVISGFRNGCFGITDSWKVDFKKKPLQFCLLMILYSLSFILFLYLGSVAVYDLLVR